MVNAGEYGSAQKTTDSDELPRLGRLIVQLFRRVNGEGDANSGMLLID
jgi:hypothetical protein